MADIKALIEQAYSAFNRRDIDGVLALVTQDVRWQKASEGGRAIGKEEIRAYWTRQWSEFDPHVEPLMGHGLSPHRHDRFDRVFGSSNAKCSKSFLGTVCDNMSE